MQKGASFEGFVFHKAPPVTNVHGMFSKTLATYCSHQLHGIISTAYGMNHSCVLFYPTLKISEGESRGLFTQIFSPYSPKTSEGLAMKGDAAETTDTLQRSTHHRSKSSQVVPHHELCHLGGSSAILPRLFVVSPMEGVCWGLSEVWALPTGEEFGATLLFPENSPYKSMFSQEELLFSFKVKDEQFWPRSWLQLNGGDCSCEVCLLKWWLLLPI